MTQHAGRMTAIELYCLVVANAKDHIPPSEKAVFAHEVAEGTVQEFIRLGQPVDDLLVEVDEDEVAQVLAACRADKVGTIAKFAEVGLIV